MRLYDDGNPEPIATLTSQWVDAPPNPGKYFNGNSWSQMYPGEGYTLPLQYLPKYLYYDKDGKLYDHVKRDPIRPKEINQSYRKKTWQRVQR